MTHLNVVNPEAQLRTLRILVAAMAIGVLCFGAIALSVAPANDQADYSALKMALWILTAAIIPAYVVLAMGSLSGSYVPQQAETNEDAMRRFYAKRFVRTLIRAALAESLALFACVVYLLSAAAATLIPAAIGLAGIIVCFPSRGAFEPAQ